MCRWSRDQHGCWRWSSDFKRHRGKQWSYNCRDAHKRESIACFCMELRISISCWLSLLQISEILWRWWNIFIWERSAKIFNCLKPTLYVVLIVRAVPASPCMSFIWRATLMWSSQTAAGACKFLALFGSKLLLTCLPQSAFSFLGNGQNPKLQWNCSLVWLVAIQRRLWCFWILQVVG